MLCVTIQMNALSRHFLLKAQCEVKFSFVLLVSIFTVFALKGLRKIITHGFITDHILREEIFN